MTDDKKTLKFQMMMSPGEAEVLDDWMFKHRIRSRAEAIRRLTQIGMVLDRRLGQLLGDLTDKEHSEARRELSKRALDLTKSTEVPTEAKVIIMELLERTQKIEARTMVAVGKMIGETHFLKSAMPVKDAIDVRKEFQEALDEMSPDEGEAITVITKMLNNLYGRPKNEDDES